MNITPNPASVKVGATVQLSSSPGSKWTSSNANVATVSGSGLVKGLSAGSATITAKKGNQKATTTVKVEAPIPVPPEPEPIPPTPTTPTAPSNAVAVLAGPLLVTLTWTDNSGNEAGFAVERTADGGATWLKLTTLGAGVTNYSDVVHTYATTFQYRVWASNATGDSSKATSNTVSTGAATTPPIEPTPIPPEPTPQPPNTSGYGPTSAATCS